MENPEGAGAHVAHLCPTAWQRPAEKGSSQLQWGKSDKCLSTSAKHAPVTSRKMYHINKHFTAAETHLSSVRYQRQWQHWLPSLAPRLTRRQWTRLQLSHQEKTFFVIAYASKTNP